MTERRNGRYFASLHRIIHLFGVDYLKVVEDRP